jgi:predicted cobalt transporter CbtA
MAEIPKNIKCLLFPVGARVMVICAFVLEILGLASLVIGIILFIYGLWWWLAGYFAAKEG